MNTDALDRYLTRCLAPRNLVPALLQRRPHLHELAGGLARWPQDLRLVRLGRARRRRLREGAPADPGRLARAYLEVLAARPAFGQHFGISQEQIRDAVCCHARLGQVAHEARRLGQLARAAGLATAELIDVIQATLELRNK